MIELLFSKHSIFLQKKIYKYPTSIQQYKMNSLRKITCTLVFTIVGPIMITTSQSSFRVVNVDGQSSSSVKLLRHPGPTDFKELSLCMRSV